MTIQCDVDGVLNNLMDVVIRLFNEKYNKNYTINDITTYDLSNCLELHDAILMKNFFEDPNIWNMVQPINGAQAGLQKIINSGNQVYLVTNNSPYTYGQKFDWIRNYFPFIESSKIVCMADKWRFDSDLIIEDCVENLLVRPCYYRVLMDQPWNQCVRDYAYGINRCSNWDEIVDAVNKICDGE